MGSNDFEGLRKRRLDICHMYLGPVDDAAVRDVVGCFSLAAAAADAPGATAGLARASTRKWTHSFF